MGMIPQPSNPSMSDSFSSGLIFRALDVATPATSIGTTPVKILEINENVGILTQFEMTANGSDSHFAILEVDGVQYTFHTASGGNAVRVYNASIHYSGLPAGINFYGYRTNMFLRFKKIVLYVADTTTASSIIVTASLIYGK
ncbi:hypothetical protein [Paenibacillus sp. NEAU-GSW1]|uniref:hypothetical protein n=1 Tax=Paenibacillus sp. NEAU-GSW1 TaxID=2682486 RepID=UPI0012E23E2D|nr:hypothetical protein [Paenibacillus sp. NEAU-GSW1]MUT66008.1 hypothetical protein [Paenibacillus sp. NEAU-GSW1]